MNHIEFNYPCDLTQEEIDKVETLIQRKIPRIIFNVCDNKGILSFTGNFSNELCVTLGILIGSLTVEILNNRK